MPGPDSLTTLADAIRKGLPGPADGMKPLMQALFADRFHARHFEQSMMRDAYALAGEGDKGVPYAGLINPENPPSGPYGGASIVWFPTSEHGSLIDFGVGTRGLSPDEGILTRPGHRRRITALRRYLSRQGIEAWTKPDPAALSVAVPKTVQRRFSEFKAVFTRYGGEIYCAARVPAELDAARLVVKAFVDLYAYERGYKPRKACQAEFDELLAALRQDTFPIVAADEVHQLLRARRFVVLQGPPGTGKTRLADEIRARRFDGRGLTVQFHPAVTYEDFVVGLSPDTKEQQLRFDARRGWLLEAARLAKEAPTLLVIDEVNRADLGKVLGEAIYLFEPGEVGGDNARTVTLPHAIDGSKELRLPENLYVLATMNTADRSIANMDLAVRRRFAFVTMHPDRAVVASNAPALGLQIFDDIADVFVEHAPDEALTLLPGHAYFLCGNEGELRERVRYELLPLIDEYLQQGLLGPAATELHAVRDAIEDLLELHAADQ